MVGGRCDVSAARALPGHRAKKWPYAGPTAAPPDVLPGRPTILAVLAGSTW